MFSKNEYEFREWEKFFINRKNFPKWPNETLTRLIYGNFLRKKIKLKKNSTVLDIGCGFGNNFTIFKNFRSKLYGTEVTKKSANKIKKILKINKINADIREGNNQNLPFERNYFDLVMSLNVIQYERSLDDINLAFQEYSRVLKTNGDIILITVAPKHYSYKYAIKVSKNVYRLKKWHFIKDQIFFYFDSKIYLKSVLKRHFKNIEIGISFENLMGTELDYFLVRAKNKK